MSKTGKEMGKKDNPFYHNYVFSQKDIDRAIIKWWKYPLLMFLPTYVQCSEGYAWFYKTFDGAIYYMKCEKLS